MDNKSQSAQLNDGVSQSSLKGQSNKIENVGNPTGMSDLKKMRNIGEIKQGTDFLRSKMGGTDNSMQSN